MILILIYLEIIYSVLMFFSLEVKISIKSQRKFTKKLLSLAILLGYSSNVILAYYCLLLLLLCANKHTV